MDPILSTEATFGLKCCRDAYKLALRRCNKDYRYGFNCWLPKPLTPQPGMERPDHINWVEDKQEMLYLMLGRYRRWQAQGPDSQNFVYQKGCLEDGTGGLTGEFGAGSPWLTMPLLPNGPPRDIKFINGTIYKPWNEVKFWECEKDKCFKRRYPCKEPIRQARDKCLWTMGWRNLNLRGANYRDPANYTEMQELLKDWDGAIRPYHEQWYKHPVANGLYSR